MDEVLDIMAQIEIDLLNNIVGSIADGGWRVDRAKAFAQFAQRNRDIVASHPTNAAVRSELMRAYREAGVKERKLIAEFASRTVSASGTGFRVNDVKMRALVAEYQGKIREVSAAATRRADDMYRQGLQKAQIALASDLYTADEAVDMAVKPFLETGINSIVYANGTRHSITDYTDMALRTGNRRATLWGEGAAREELGVYTVLITQYGGCSDTCLPWQGRVYFDDVYSGGAPTQNTTEFPLLSEAIAGGLFHPRCKHSSNTYYPDITDVPEQMNAEEVQRVSELTNKQAYNERQIRKWKRLRDFAQDSKNRQKYASKVRQWQDINQELIDANPGVLRRRYKREREVLETIAQ